MPAKLTSAAAVPTLVGERLSLWGRAIRARRIARRMSMRELSARTDLSRATLQRLEHGDPGASAAAYLRVLMVLDLIDEAAPAVPLQRWASPSAGDTRAARSTPSVSSDDDAWF